MAKPSADLRLASNRAAVQATNDDAYASKLSCVKKGYMKDDYVHLFVKRPVRRSPIINLGYFARYAALRKLLYQFLECEIDSNEKRRLQEVNMSLGAGFDTTFFSCRIEDVHCWAFTILWLCIQRKDFFLIMNGRIERLELFDEFEEWYMMQEHYCVDYAINDALLGFC